MKTPILLTALTLLTLSSATVQAQGPLANPGPPGPTMKSLDQIEARTAIPKSPVVPGAGPHFVISQPGSYYLTGNIEVTSGNGINITASNVTLDLNGFSLISKTASPAGGSAISITGGMAGIEIKNGHITGGTARTPVGDSQWDATFTPAGWNDGVFGPFAKSVILTQLTTERCGNFGIRLGKANISYISANGNGAGGIMTSGGAVITNATATENGGDGINAYSGTVANANSGNNMGSGIAAELDVVTNATAVFNGSIGIKAGLGVVSNSRAQANFKAGIFVSLGVASHCVAYLNSTDPTTVDNEIFILPGGQRDACVPALE